MFHRDRKLSTDSHPHSSSPALNMVTQEDIARAANYGVRQGDGAHKSPSTQEILHIQRTLGNQAAMRMLAASPARSAAQKPTVQRYEEKEDADGDTWRVSESGDSALYIKQAEGGDTLAATPALIKSANKALAKAGSNGSFVRLAATPNGIKDGLLDGVSPDARMVTPRLVTVGPDPGNAKLDEINKGSRADDDGSTGAEFALWADCGRSSRAVMGTDGSGKKPSAHYDVNGAEKVTDPSSNPAAFTKVYKEAMPGFMADPDNRAFLQEGIHYDNKKKFSWSEFKFHINEIIKTPADDKEAKKMYWELGEAGREKFDMATGVNVGANPDIGGAYTLSTEKDMPGFASSGKTWNFHWAGVVMKDGSNNITLENYAVSYGSSPDPVENQRLQQQAYDEVNRSYVFQMYGTKVIGQSFHEQHIASGTHGNRGSTFAVNVGK